MEHKVILQAHDDHGNMHTWKSFDIKSYLISENHIYGNEFWKFHKGMVNGFELDYSKDYPNLMRDVGDFQSYCRRNIDRKHIDTAIPQEILDKFLLGESERTRMRNYQEIQSGAKDLSEYYKNGGGGMCEYRPGYIEGYDLMNSKGVKISWINEDADVCHGITSRTTIFNRIRELIALNVYFKGENKSMPRIVFYEDKNQLPGQMNIMDFMGV